MNAAGPGPRCSAEQDKAGDLVWLQVSGVGRPGRAPELLWVGAEHGVRLAVVLLDTLSPLRFAEKCWENAWEMGKCMGNSVQYSNTCISETNMFQIIKVLSSCMQKQGVFMTAPVTPHTEIKTVTQVMPK